MLPVKTDLVLRKKNCDIRLYNVNELSFQSENKIEISKKLQHGPRSITCPQPVLLFLVRGVGCVIICREL